MLEVRHTWRFWAALTAVYAALIVLPHGLSFSQKEIVVFLLINVLVVASYRLLTLTGEWSLGHAVMVGVGAYATALISKRLGVPVPLSILCGASGGRRHRVSPQLSVVSDEGVLFPDRLIRRG